MKCSASIKELATALSKAQAIFNHAKKETKNEFFRSQYADLASVIDAAKKPLSDNGLSVCQVCDTTESGDIRLETILMHSSGEWISGSYPIKPIKNDPQAYGSAITYARRYAFSAITGIAADDDDGNQASHQQPPQKQAKFVTQREIPKNPEMKIDNTDYTGIIVESKSLDDLSKAWVSIPKIRHQEYVELKNQMKAKLTKPRDNFDE